MTTSETPRDDKRKSDGKLVPTFLQKTYLLVDVSGSKQNKDFKDIVSWGEEPCTFVISDTNRFAREVLPQFFKQNKMSSFVRQLNMYDFHKRTSNVNKHIFHHPCFERGNEALLANIKRKKNVKRGTQRQSVSPDPSMSSIRARSAFLEEVGAGKPVQDEQELRGPTGALRPRAGPQLQQSVGRLQAAHARAQQC